MRVVAKRSDYLATVFVAGVALIFLVHYLRDNYTHGALATLLLGVTPNFITAFSLPVVFLGHKRTAERVLGEIRDVIWFVACTAAGLVIVTIWEFRQINMPRFVFDPNDLGASLVGAALFLCCWPIARRFMAAA